jgi:two-component system response regulator HydG
MASPAIDNHDAMLNNSGQVSSWALAKASRPIILQAECPQAILMAKILCVDDEPHIVTLKCAILEAAGHQVTPATSAQEAIEKLELNSYDAVVTDWRLGDSNGRAIVQAAKMHSTMPVVVVSGYVAEAFQAAEPLADLYLEKPVNPEELVTIVNELLKTSEHTQ